MQHDEVPGAGDLEPRYYVLAGHSRGARDPLVGGAGVCAVYVAVVHMIFVPEMPGS